METKSNIPSPRWQRPACPSSCPPNRPTARQPHPAPTQKQPPTVYYDESGSWICWCRTGHHPDPTTDQQCGQSNSPAIEPTPSPTRPPIQPTAHAHAHARKAGKINPSQPRQTPREPRRRLPPGLHRRRQSKRRPPIQPNRRRRLHRRLLRRTLQCRPTSQVADATACPPTTPAPWPSVRPAPTAAGGSSGSTATADRPDPTCPTPRPG